MDLITESPGLYWPVSRKYDVIDGKYKFFEAASADRMQAYYPLIRFGRFSYSCGRRNDTNLKSQISVESETNIGEFTKESNETINDLSNDILLTIFAYFHPIDLIHCLSLVCQRWNYLINHSALLTEVRVLVNDLSLEYDSVKMFFHRTSQHLRKLCIDCSVPLPSASVNALFDICFPNVVHLDIGSFKEMNTTLLAKLSNCFPNVETLHMDEVKRSSKCDENAEEWKKTLKMLFEDESIFPRVRNFFVGDVSVYSSDIDSKLPACKRPLNLLFINNGIENIDFNAIRISPWQSTLTEFHLGSCLKGSDIQYVAGLHNLKAFSWNIWYDTVDEEFAHIKNLYNLEELQVRFSGEDGYISSDMLIALFTLPGKEPEKSFPYKLQHLIMENFCGGNIELFEVINRNCPNLRTFGIPSNFFILETGVIHFIASHFKHLVFLDLSNLEDCYEDEGEVWNDLNEDDLPDLRLLKLHGNKVNIEDLQHLNLKRPKLLISTRKNYFINWTKTENGCVFHDTFDGDIKAVVNDLRQIDGLRRLAIISTSSLYDNCDVNTLTRSSSVSSLKYRRRFYDGNSV